MACTFSAQRHNSKTISLPLVLFTDSLQKKKGGGVKLFQRHPNWLAFVTSKNAVLNNKTKTYIKINFNKKIRLFPYYLLNQILLSPTHALSHTTMY